MADRLTRLERESIHILREAHATCRALGMLWSIGKDSTALLWMARKAFFGAIPFPLIHVDTTYKIPEMIQYRDRIVRSWNLELIVSKNEAALAEKRVFPEGNADRLTCCRLLKTLPLRNVIEGRGDLYRMNNATGVLEAIAKPQPFSGLILGIRGDEEGTRSKERYFSVRTEDNSWDINDQPPEPWGYHQTKLPPRAHLRVHPLLDWTELDIWEYIAREQIEVVPLYYARDGKRYRSLGCGCCTHPIVSNAGNVSQIVDELSTGTQSRCSERAGRAQDSEDGGGLETLRRGGYM